MEEAVEGLNLEGEYVVGKVKEEEEKGSEVEAMDSEVMGSEVAAMDWEVEVLDWEAEVLDWEVEMVVVVFLEAALQAMPTHSCHLLLAFVSVPHRSHQRYIIACKRVRVK